MIMADIFKILFPIVGTLMSFVCYCLLFEGTFPASVERCRQTYKKRPIRSLLLGCLFGIPGMVLGVAFLNSGNPLGLFLGFSTLFLLSSFALLGAAGLSSLIGHRLNSPQDTQQPWKRVYRGSVVLSLTFIFPMLGWFLVLPATLLSGLGAALISLRVRKKEEGKPSEPEMEMAQS
jgi:hypothetical protein